MRFTRIQTETRPRNYLEASQLRSIQKKMKNTEYRVYVTELTWIGSCGTKAMER